MVDMHLTPILKKITNDSWENGRAQGRIEVYKQVLNLIKESDNYDDFVDKFISEAEKENS